MKFGERAVPNIATEQTSTTHAAARDATPLIGSHDTVCYRSSGFRCTASDKNDLDRPGGCQLQNPYIIDPFSETSAIHYIYLSPTCGHTTSPLYLVCILSIAQNQYLPHGCK